MPSKHTWRGREILGSACCCSAISFHCATCARRCHDLHFSASWRAEDLCINAVQIL